MSGSDIELLRRLGQQAEQREQGQATGVPNVYPTYGTLGSMTIAPPLNYSYYNYNNPNFRYYQVPVMDPMYPAYITSYEAEANARRERALFETKMADMQRSYEAAIRNADYLLSGLPAAAPPVTQKRESLKAPEVKPRVIRLEEE